MRGPSIAHAALLFMCCPMFDQYRRTLLWLMKAREQAKNALAECFQSVTSHVTWQHLGPRRMPALEYITQSAQQLSDLLLPLLATESPSPSCAISAELQQRMRDIVISNMRLSDAVAAACVSAIVPLFERLVVAEHKVVFKRADPATCDSVIAQIQDFSDAAGRLWSTASVKELNARLRASEAELEDEYKDAVKSIAATPEQIARLKQWYRDMKSGKIKHDHFVFVEPDTIALSQRVLHDSTGQLFAQCMLPVPFMPTVAVWAVIKRKAEALQEELDARKDSDMGKRLGKDVGAASEEIDSKLAAEARDTDVAPAVIELCGRVGCRNTSESMALKRCSRCRSRWYCSTDCQRQDWPSHKRTCRELAA